MVGLQGRSGQRPMTVEFAGGPDNLVGPPERSKGEVVAPTAARPPTGLSAPPKPCFLQTNSETTLAPIGYRLAPRHKQALTRTAFVVAGLAFVRVSHQASRSREPLARQRGAIGVPGRFKNPLPCPLIPFLSACPRDSSRLLRRRRNRRLPFPGGRPPTQTSTHAW